MVPVMLGLAGWIYGAAALTLGLGFIAHAASVWFDQADAAGTSARNDRPARRAFRFSLLYLAVLYLAFAADALARFGR